MLTLIFTPSANHKKGEMVGIGYLHFDPETNSFSCYASDAMIQTNSKNETVIVKNTETGNEITFKFTNADMDGSGEDTYGWNFKAIKGNKFPCTLLIIND